MNNTYIKKGLLALVLIFGFVLIKQNFVSSAKLSGDYISDQDLLDKSSYVVQGIVVGRNEVLNYSSLEFITFDFLIKEKIKGNLVEKNIRILQTIVPNDDTFKLLERGTDYILFIDDYIGPIIENAYVICGVDLGKIKISNGNVVFNQRQLETFRILKQGNALGFTKNISMNRIKAQ